jgi:WS/DGAT/MGAT family acyltransferase
VDAPAFDLDQHLRVVPLDPPGDEAALLRAVESLRRDRLSRSRPLWQLCLLPGLADHRVGLFVRMHHALADGIAGIATIGTLLDLAPEPIVAAPAPWRPRPAPSGGALFADNLGRLARRATKALGALARPWVIVRTVRAAWPGVRELLATPAEPPTSLNRLIGADRAIVLIRSDLDLVKRIAHTYGATVNDVLLAVTAAGLGRLLATRGEPTEDRSQRVSVPVSLRSADGRAQARGNLVAQIIVPVPIGALDPGLRLATVAAETRTRKAAEHPSLGVVLRSRLVRRALLRVLERQPVNVTSSDLVGPPVPVYLAGARVLELFPLLPLMANVSVGVGALSYAGRLAIAVIADRDAYPDVDVLGAGIAAELDALAASVSVRPL